MAVIADTVLEQGGEVTGIEAQMFVDKGVAHKNLTQLTDRAEYHRTAYSHDRAWRRVHRLPRRHGNVGGDQ